MENYDHQKIEKKWQKFWKKNKTFRCDSNDDREKFYVLDMFPYPSGAGLHVGHPLGYTATDIIARKKRMENFNVLHPMGWDAFGLPAENFAIKNKVHPAICTQKNIKNFRRQIRELGFSYDWDREIDSTDPNYFKWTQWIFLKLFNSYFDKQEGRARPISILQEKFDATNPQLDSLNLQLESLNPRLKSGVKWVEATELEKAKILAQYRLAYETEAPINFCPSCKTGLANEEVVDGKCERCSAIVERKNLRQWILRITKYAERLLLDLNSPTAFVLHGWGADSKDNWFTFAAKNLQKLGFETFIPDFPSSQNPLYKDWKEFFIKNYASKLNQNSLIVAHSLGAPFILRFLTEQNLKIDQLILVAPATDDCGITEIANFFKDFSINSLKNKKLNSSVFKNNIAREISIIFSDNDQFISKNKFEKFIEKLNAKKIFYKNRGHFCEKELPELMPIFKNAAKSILDWPEKIRAMQKNWIGRGEGIEIEYEVCADEKKEKNYQDYSKNNSAKLSLKKKDEPNPINGGHSKGDHSYASFQTKSILFKKIIEVKKLRYRKFRLQKTQKTFLYGNKKIIFNGKKIFCHFLQKSKSELQFRLSLAATIFFAIENLFFESENVGFFRVKNSIFKVILEKNSNNDFFVKTFYRSQKLSREFIAQNSLSEKIRVFTKFPETNFGATFIVIAPEHPIVKKITTPKHKKEVEKYLKRCSSMSDLQRTELNKEKTGAFTGAYAHHGLTGRKLPIYVADFVLAHVGTGQVVGVPGHDERDFEFAQNFNLPILRVLKKKKNDADDEPIDSLKKVFHDGIACNSQFLDGLSSTEAREKIKDFLEKKGWGKRVVNFKLRDWIFSRQRFWGEPIPIIHCEKCGPVSGVANWWEFENFTQLKKEGVARPGPYVPTGGGPQVRPDQPSKFKPILMGNFYDCKFGFDSKELPRKILKKIEKKARQIKFLNSPIFGKVEFSWKKLRAHFWKKGVAEFRHRRRFISATIETLQNSTKFSQVEENSIMHATIKDTIFTIIVGQKSGKYFLRTFYKSKKLSDAWKNLKSEIGMLPLKLPEVKNYEPSGDGTSPLSKIKSFVETICPKCGTPAKRETNTMPQWAGSSWYWLRFADPKNSQKFCNKKIEEKFCPVDLYVGGAEHAVLHLLYARFWHKVLFDLGYVSTHEPFKALKNQGMILASDGQKMSKSLGNVVNPDDIVKKFGADTLRVYEMFMGPFEQAKSWNDGAVAGIRKFLDRIWKIFNEKKIITKFTDKKLQKTLHQTIQKVTYDIDNFKFNTAISQMMVLINIAEKAENLPQEFWEKFIKILSPFAPHLCEELWSNLINKYLKPLVPNNINLDAINKDNINLDTLNNPNKESISFQPWPNFDEDLAREDEVNFAISVNGKLRATISASVEIDKEEMLKKAREHEKLQKWLNGKKIIKEIFVPGKIVNFVVK